MERLVLPLVAAAILLTAPGAAAAPGLVGTLLAGASGSVAEEVATAFHGCPEKKRAPHAMPLVAPTAPENDDAPPFLSFGLMTVVAGGAAWVGARAGWLRPSVWLAPLYTRLGPRAIVEHPARARILTVVRESPGVTTAELVADVGLHAGTVTHHLRTLERARFVKSLKVGRDLMWFEAGSSVPDETRLAALRAPARQALLDVIARRPGIPQAELARAVGLSKATVHHHLAALDAARLVDLRRDGLRVRCYPRRDA